MKKIIFLIIVISINLNISGQQKHLYKVVGYYSGDSASFHRYDVGKLTHLIYGFVHLDNGNVSSSAKSISALNAFKKIKAQNPVLKTMVALGGWGGCEFCSQTFADKLLVKKFALSVKDLLNKYELDGIDLDWEYPVIAGPEGHQHLPEDKQNFSNLVIELRAVLGKKVLITFAAGGFEKYLQQSIDWHKIEPYVDFVNLMTYDLVHGGSTQTGHLTNLFSSNENEQSVNKAIQFFRKIKFPLKKIIVGSGFYAREFKNVKNINNGLYQPGLFFDFVGYAKGKHKYIPENGFIAYWDDKAKAPYWYNASKEIFATGENKISLGLKCAYIKKNKLGGLMFWELATDSPKDGLYNFIKF